MTDNVIILGAGASVDAGIPLLANFVEKMWEFAVKGTHNGEKLSDEDKKIFDEAIKVRKELDGYHGRASFNDRNIEDLLSILSFNLIGGKRSDREKLNWILRAIARTIELTCTVKHDGQLNVMQDIGPEVYRGFWHNLFKRFEGSIASFPSIISFNYDLVLERSLFQTLINTYFGSGLDHLWFDGISLKYHYKLLRNVSYTIKNTQYGVERYDDYRFQPGTKLEYCSTNNIKKPFDIEILKLHGSLNFPSEALAHQQQINPVTPAKNPYILPPIINKWAGKNEEEMWGTGLNRLREAKNIIIIGYSLPKTDIYMQYFLKAGVGPNVNLNKIIVFNPTLYKSGKENDEMRERFGSCFSPQLQTLIDFTPDGDERQHYSPRGEKGIPGSFEHFVYSIYTNNNTFFG